MLSNIIVTIIEHIIIDKKVCRILAYI